MAWRECPASPAADNTAQLSIAFLGDAPAMTPVDSAPSAPSAPGDTQQQPPATTTPPTTTTPPVVDTPYYPGSLYGPSGVASLKSERSEVMREGKASNSSFHSRHR